MIQIRRLPSKSHEDGEVFVSPVGSFTLIRLTGFGYMQQDGLFRGPDGKEYEGTFWGPFFKRGQKYDNLEIKYGVTN